MKRSEIAMILSICSMIWAFFLELNDLPMRDQLILVVIFGAISCLVKDA
jgi:hypothetical protein